MDLCKVEVVGSFNLAIMSLISLLLFSICPIKFSCVPGACREMDGGVCCSGYSSVGISSSGFCGF